MATINPALMPIKSKGVTLGAVGTSVEIPNLNASNISVIMTIMVSGTNQTQWFYNTSVVAYIDRTYQKIYVVNSETDFVGRTAYVFYM